jgi:WD40 repeat protein
MAVLLPIPIVSIDLPSTISHKSCFVNRNILSKLFLFWMLCGLVQAQEGGAQAPVRFADQVAPVLQEHCVACHCAKRAEGGYRLDTVEQMLKPGDGASAPVVSGKSQESEWVQRLRHADRTLRMPADSEPLDAASIELVANWIDQGADVQGLSLTDPLWMVIPPRTYPAPPEHYRNPIPVTAMLWSPDGKLLYTSGYHEVLVWNVEAGTLAGRIANQVQRIHALRWSADGNKLYVGGGIPGQLGEVRRVDRATGAVEAVLVRASDVVLDIALRPGKAEIAVGLADNTLRIVDVAQGVTRKTVSIHADWVTQVSYSNDGARIGSSSRDKSAKVIDAESGELLGSYPGHGAAVRGIAAIENGLQWVSVGGDNKLHRWELEGAKKVAEVALGGEAARLVRETNTVWIPNADKHWYRFELANNAIAMKQPGHEDWVTSLSVLPAPALLATGGMDGMIRTWNLGDGTNLKVWSSKP